jgi:hypothetical protein
MFLFEAQTGRTSKSFYSSKSAEVHDWPSNFYHYLIYDKHRKWVEAAVDRATIGSGGLQFEDQRQFLEKLKDRDIQPAIQNGREVHDWYSPETMGPYR